MPAQNPFKKGQAPKVDQGRLLEAVTLCCLRGCQGVTEKEERSASTATGLAERDSNSPSPEVCKESGFTLVKRGSRKGPVLTGPRNPLKEEKNNRFSLLTPSEEEDGGPPGLIDSEVRVQGELHTGT